MTAPLHVIAPDDQFEPSLLPGAVRYLRASAGAQVGLTELEPHSLRAHRAHFGIRPPCTDAEALIGELERVALTGRGGGHFPAAAKWRAIRGAGGSPVVIGNGAEGEPQSRKDAALLELRPHLVLDGLASAAEALGAREAVLWLHEGDHPARSAVARALAERIAAHVDEPALRVAYGPDHYLTGEASAAARGVSGGTALPFFHRRPVALGGIDGRPTLVQNVETLARVALVARGADAADSVLVSVADGDSIIVLEVPDGYTIRDAVAAALGERDHSAVLIGGYGGSWLGWDDAAQVRLRESDLRAHGLSSGAGVLAVLPADRCGIARAAEIAEFLAQSSARQCGPCLFGLRAVADSMHALADGGWRNRREAKRLAGFLAQVRGRGACHHPDGAVRMVASAVAVFDADADAHLHGRCVHAPETKRARRG